MDYPRPSQAVEAQDSFAYHQGGDSQGTAVQWSQQDNQYYQNAANSQTNDSAYYNNNVVIEQPVQELPPPPVQYTPEPCDYNYSNNCYGNNNYYNPGAAFAEGVVGGIIGGVLFGGRREWGYSPRFYEPRPYYGGGGWEHRGGFERGGGFEHRGGGGGFEHHGGGGHRR